MSPGTQYASRFAVGRQETRHLARASQDFTYPSLTLTADLVQSFFTTNNQCLFHAKKSEDLDKAITQLLLRHPKDHSLRHGRVDERSENVEDCTEIQRATDRCNVRQGGVVVGCEQEKEW